MPLTNEQAEQLFFKEHAQARERADAVARGEPVPLFSEDEARVTGDPRDRLPYRFDLDAQDPKLGERSLRIRGRDVPLTPVRARIARMQGRLAQQISRLETLFQETDDDAEAARLDEEIEQRQRRLIQLVIPALPEDVLETLSMGELKRLSELVDDLIRADLGLPSRAEEAAAKARDPKPVPA